MHLEIPVFGRCCCCFPLRGGLLSYGYIKLVISICNIVQICNVGSVFRASHTSEQSTILGVVLIATAALVLFDVAMTLALLVGGHRKSPAPLKVYMWYQIVCLVLQVVLAVLVFLFSPVETEDESGFARNNPLYNGRFLNILVLNSVFSFYVMCCIRSQILKLEGKEETAQYEFSNVQKV